MKGVAPHRGPTPPMAKKWPRVAETPQTLLSQNLISRNSMEHLHIADLFLDEICENKTQV
ncbi:hypothetical protein MTR67_039053 [Solanum verrucosum]|uniref:Uncharacterized protein n=1 Tax=Solanum verrucosum TaxID=315347 RepID=A0AAF0UG89_SOLVR|nr:hypothetical protein MTR67_039053 [Solanum verrucosum]